MAILLRCLSFILMFLCFLVFAKNCFAQDEKTAVFPVKYISSDSVYIGAGHNAGVQEGMKLSVVNAQEGVSVDNGLRFRGEAHVAELRVVSVADASAVCDIVSTTGELKIGQIAFLTPESVQERREVVSAEESESYPVVVSFTYGDPLDDEVIQSQEKKVIQETPIGRMRGQLGFD